MMLFRGPNKAARRARQSHRAQFRDGVRLAAVRAFTGGDLYLRGEMTLRQTAIAVGSNVLYVMAAVILLKANDTRLIKDVVHGRIGILAAAESVKPLVTMLAGYSKASPTNRDAFFVATG